MARGIAASISETAIEAPAGGMARSGPGRNCGLQMAAEVTNVAEEGAELPLLRALRLAGLAPLLVHGSRGALLGLVLLDASLPAMHDRFRRS